MDDSGWLPDEADEPRTDVHRRVIDGGRCLELEVRVADETASVQLRLTEPGGLMVGRVAGDLPAASLPVAGQLIGDAMSAAGHAHRGTDKVRSARQPSRRRNQGARWTPEEEALLSERFAAGASIAELRSEFGRSDNSIRARLVQLELLPAEELPSGLGGASSGSLMPGQPPMSRMIRMDWPSRGPVPSRPSARWPSSISGVRRRGAIGSAPDL